MSNKWNKDTEPGPSDAAEWKSWINPEAEPKDSFLGVCEAPEDLDIDPEDFNIDPEDIQTDCDAWVIGDEPDAELTSEPWTTEVEPGMTDACEWKSWINPDATIENSFLGVCEAPEDLNVDPEDFDINPEDIQTDCDSWDVQPDADAEITGNPWTMEEEPGPTDASEWKAWVNPKALPKNSFLGVCEGPEDLDVDPEDFGINPLDVQSDCDDWTVLPDADAEVTGNPWTTETEPGMTDSDEWKSWVNPNAEAKDSFLGVCEAPEDLMVDPEDFDIDPEDVQADCEDWTFPEDVTDTVFLGFNPTEYGLVEGGTVLLFVERTGGCEGTASVDYETVDGTAIAGVDFVAASGRLEWADGEKGSKTFSIQSLSDATTESNESFTVILSNPCGNSPGDTEISQGTATVTIGENIIVFNSATYVAVESSLKAVVTLVRLNSDVGAVSVRLQTSDGTAIAGQDYVAVDTTVSWADGDTADKTVEITLIDDNECEGDETFNVTLSEPVNATLGTPSSAVVTIQDDLTDDEITLTLTEDTINAVMFDLFGSPTGDKTYVLRVPDGITMQSFALSTDQTLGRCLQTGSGWNAAATLKLVLESTDADLIASGGWGGLGAHVNAGKIGFTVRGGGGGGGAGGLTDTFGGIGQASCRFTDSTGVEKGANGTESAGGMGGTMLCGPPPAIGGCFPTAGGGGGTAIEMDFDLTIDNTAQGKIWAGGGGGGGSGVDNFCDLPGGDLMGGDGGANGQAGTAGESNTVHTSHPLNAGFRIGGAGGAGGNAIITNGHTVTFVDGDQGNLLGAIV